jgi:vancomycin resistance protein VanJ
MGLLALAHAAVLLGWVAVHALLGDSRWWSFLLNTFVLYLFVPLAVTVPLALLLRRPLLRACALFGVVLFLVTYGGLFVPPALRAAPPADAPRLRALTFNVHVTNPNPDGVAAAIRRAGADVVGLQEVNPAVARALRRDLAVRYPYQVLGAAGVSSTLAVLSRYPLQPTGITLPGHWNEAPLVVRLRFAGTTVTVLDAHPVSTLLTRAQIRAETQERAYTARVIAAFVRAQRGPVLVLADFNATDQSTPYRIVTQVLGDAWREGGVGFGHTFPGDDPFDGSHPGVRAWLIPRWLVRIDYVFHSRQWRTVEAHLGPWDGTSDHRPVCATLALTSRA